MFFTPVPPGFDGGFISEMPKNLLLCVLGIFVGFVVGFVITDKVTKPFAGGSPAASAAPAGADARPLSPDQMDAELPPGHPSVEGGAGAGGAGSAASTSAEAQAAMEKADRAPKDFAAQSEAARVFYKLHDYDKAALYADRALKLKGTDFDALVLMGNAKYDAKDFAGAAGFYERALAVRPASPDVRTDLGNTHFNRGDYDRALAEYRKSLAIDPDHLNSWRNIAAASLQKGDKKTAEEAVGQLSRLAPQSEEVEAYRRKLAEMP
jgi:tetratricopeptide (TPR) repeat protein